MCQRNRILAAACLASLAPLGASAATICVNPGATDGCLSSIAAALASAAPTGDTISVAAGTYHESGMLIDRSVDIVGAGVDLTVVDGSTGGVNASQSIFRFPGFTVPVTSTLSRLTVRGGARGLDAGGGNTVTVDHARFTANGPWTGAGLFNGASILNVKATLVDGNSATDNGSIAGCDWGGGSGGGLASLCGGGNNYISNSAFVGNTASRWGGGLIVNDGQTVIENTTISGNSAQFSDPGLAGSAFFMGGAFPDITLRYSTIANNSGMGPVIQADGKLKLQATLVQGNTGAACSTDANNPIASLGYNMVSDGTCLFAQAGDAINTDAHLLPLASNGVDTPTHALPATSPAVDRIPTPPAA